MASPVKYQRREMPHPPVADAGMGGMVTSRPVAEMFVVRSPLGAWTASGGDGTATDGDGHHDGKVTIATGRLLPVGDTPPGPPSVLPGDIVFAIDPTWMEFSVVRIAKGAGHAP